jgi:hypothetical protein
MLENKIDSTLIFGIISALVAVTYITKKPDNTFTN